MSLRLVFLYILAQKRKKNLKTTVDLKKNSNIKEF